MLTNISFVVFFGFHPTALNQSARHRVLEFKKAIVPGEEPLGLVARKSCWSCILCLLGNVTGYPGVFQGNPHPYPSKPAPASTGAGFHRYG